MSTTLIGLIHGRRGNASTCLLVCYFFLWPFLVEIRLTSQLLAKRALTMIRDGLTLRMIYFLRFPLEPGVLGCGRSVRLASFRTITPMMYLTFFTPAGRWSEPWRFQRRLQRSQNLLARFPHSLRGGPLFKLSCMLFSWNLIGFSE